MSVEDETAIVPFEEQFRQDVLALWAKCGLVRAWNDPGKDIDRKLTDRNGRFPVLLVGQRVVGSVMVSYDGHRGSVYYLAVDPAFQGRGFGKRLMEYCETFLLEIGCPKINLFVRSDNEAVLRFYEDLGFSQDAAMPLGKRLIPDD